MSSDCEINETKQWTRIHVAVIVGEMNSHPIKIQNQNKQKAHASEKGKRILRNQHLKILLVSEVARNHKTNGSLLQTQ